MRYGLKITVCKYVYRAWKNMNIRMCLFNNGKVWVFGNTVTKEALVVQKIIYPFIRLSMLRLHVMTYRLFRYKSLIDVIWRSFRLLRLGTSVTVNEYEWNSGSLVRWYWHVVIYMLDKHLWNCQFVHHKSSCNCPWIEPAHPRQEVGELPPESWHCLMYNVKSCPWTSIFTTSLTLRLIKVLEAVVRYVLPCYTYFITLGVIPGRTACRLVNCYRRFVRSCFLIFGVCLGLLDS
jgi:hypothetical protein